MTAKDKIQIYFEQTCQDIEKASHRSKMTQVKYLVFYNIVFAISYQYYNYVR